MQKEGDINWRYLIDTIKNGRCVLFLGPEACLNHNEQSFHELLVEKLAPSDNKNIKYYLQEEELFLFQNNTCKDEVILDIKEFYEQQTGEYLREYYEKLVQIPFPLIISISPDLVLKEVYRQSGYDFDYNFYEKKKEKKELALPAREKPLLYNLFGSIEKDESLILTHEDLFTFIAGVLADNSLPENLRNALADCKSCIFLGFKFEKWYVRLLLMLLGIKEDARKYALQPAYAGAVSNGASVPSQESRIFLEDRLKIEFVEDQAQAFVNVLYEKCREASLMKEKSVNQTSKKVMENNDSIRDVFISYSTKDQEAKSELVELLEKEGISYWLDETSLNLGGNIVDGLHDGLRKTRYTILIASENSMLSTWVCHESLFRLTQEIFTNEVSFLPVIIDKSVFQDDFPFQMHDKFDDEIKKQEELRQKAVARNMTTEMYDRRIQRLRDVLPNIPKIVGKIVEGLSANFAGDPKRKAADIEKLIGIIKKGKAPQSST